MVDPSGSTTQAKRNMKISELIKTLQMAQDEEGDIEVTCTGCLSPDAEDDLGAMNGEPFETTVANIQIHNHDEIGRCIRLHL